MVRKMIFYDKQTVLYVVVGSPGTKGNKRG